MLLIERRMLDCLAGLICLASCFFTASACAETDAAKVKWSYVGEDGPNTWGTLSPQYTACNGKSQTPIDITNSTPATDKLEINYAPAPLVIEEDGITELMIGKTETVTNTGHSIQVNFAPTLQTEKLMYKGKIYRLVQFHFHTPSENHIKGKEYAGEIHFVNQSDDGTIAVLAVMVKPGLQSPALKKILDNVPKEAGVEVEVIGEHINPSLFLPADQDYYHFKGSLTTPPCTEGLEWIVLSHPIQVSEKQLEELKATAHGDNARPLQPVNTRRVTFTGE